MIAFNHNILFGDEPTLDTQGIYNDDIPTIVIKEQLLIDSFEPSKWIDMSGRDIRYYRFKKSHLSWGFEIRDILILIWDSTTREIRYMKSHLYTKEKLRFWVLHTFLPMILQLEKTFHILHVGCVDIDGEAILLLAPSFGGKSTLVDYFVKSGHTILSDDTLAIDRVNNIYYALSSYPFYRPYREIDSLGIEIDNFASTPRPINSLYLLQQSPPNASIEIVEIFGIEKFQALHNALFIDFEDIREDTFAFLIEFSSHITIYKINIPWNKDRLSDVYENIIKKTESLPHKR